ncbi:cell-wall binding lipofamily protein [Bacillus thuringiensis serovar morrisoni]|nr:cell-wall binding lipofamily protein [Bacillus thuringiensis serovar morrisoni]
MNIKKVLMAVTLLVGVLSGCSGKNPEKQLYTTFENTASKEKLLVNNKKKLEHLETKTQELYSQILQDGKENNESVTGKIDQAMANIDEREKIINKEKDLLENEQKKVKSRMVN